MLAACRYQEGQIDRWSIAMSAQCKGAAGREAGGMMREWCGCGAGIRGRRKDIREWRTTHRHDRDNPEPEPQGAFADSQIGFRPIPGYESFTDERSIPIVEAKRD